jgi:hypothetical protein
MVELLMAALLYATGAPFFWPMSPIFSPGNGVALPRFAVFR